MTPTSEDEGYRRKHEMERKRKGDDPSKKKSARPSAILAIKGLPDDVDEAQLRALFAPIPGILQLTLWKDKNNPENVEEKDDDDEKRVENNKNKISIEKEIPNEFLNKATLEMYNMAAATTLLASEWKNNAYYKHHRLELDYQQGFVGESDWVCTSSFCSTTNTTNTTPHENSRTILTSRSTVNYAWRSQCYKCQAPRTPACPAVESAGEEILKQKERQQEQALIEAGWEPKAFCQEDEVDVEETVGKVSQQSGKEEEKQRASPGVAAAGPAGSMEKTVTVAAAGPLYANSVGSAGVKKLNVAVIGAAPQIDREALRLAEEERKARKLLDQLEKNNGVASEVNGVVTGAATNAPQVQGVVHRGKWAQRRATQQEQQQQ
jgi:hypothetical protein